MRADEESRTQEQQRNTEMRRQVRLDLKRKQIERDQDRIAKKLKRCEIKDSISFDDLRVIYEINIKKGPTIVCTSCSGLFFDGSIK
jgi:hypothetical protein